MMYNTTNLDSDADDITCLITYVCYVEYCTIITSHACFIRQKSALLLCSLLLVRSLSTANFISLANIVMYREVEMPVTAEV